MADPAAAFTAMAERIAKIDPKDFGGAVVIVPPGGGEASVEFVLSDPAPVLAQFYTTAQSRLELAAAQAKDAEIQAAPWTRR